MTGPAHRRDHTLGVALTLTSAVTFGATGVLAKLAYGAGANVATVLAGRFTLAALLLWAVVAWRARSGGVRTPPPGVALAAVALGAVVYAGEAALYFSALERLDASLVTLLVATYPVLVLAVAVAVGRERPDRRRAVALGAALAGAVLVLGGAQAGGLSTPGLLFAASATVAYAAYVLVADRFAGRMDGTLLAALVISGSALGTVAYGGVSGGIDLTQPSAGWASIGALAALCTVVPIASFLLALPRVGPGTASILSTFETVVGVGLAAVLLGDDLGPGQLAGAALVLGAVVLLQVRAPGRVETDGAAPDLPARPPARALAEQPA